MAKKKKSQKRPAQPGIDPNEKRRERLDAKRAAKAQALAEKQKKEARERLIRRIAMGALLAFAVWFLFIRPMAPNEINGNPINDFSTAGANLHTDQPITYEDSPPVSGQHASRSTDCGVYAAAIPNETMVHNLEHGAIGLLYKPDTDPEDIKTLESIVGDYDHSVFSMPYEGEMDSPITIAAWAHTMELDTADNESVVAFIEEFRRGGDAPEAKTAPECEHQDPEPFGEAAAGEEGAEATPTPEGEENHSPGEEPHSPGEEPHSPEAEPSPSAS